MSTTRPPHLDIDAAMAALHQAQQAILIAKAALAGDTSPALFITSTPGSYDADKHGRFDAPSAAAIARDVPHLPQRKGSSKYCDLCGVEHWTPLPDGYYEGIYGDEEAVS